MAGEIIVNESDLYVDEKHSCSGSTCQLTVSRMLLEVKDDIICGKELQGVYCTSSSPGESLAQPAFIPLELEAEFAAWEGASDEDYESFEDYLAE